MTRSDVLASVEALTRTTPGTLRGPELLNDIGGWDSMCNVEFRMSVEARLGMELDGVAVEKCRTVNDLIHLLGDAIDDAA